MRQLGKEGVFADKGKSPFSIYSVGYKVNCMDKPADLNRQATKELKAA